VTAAAYVVAARLRLSPDVDPAAVGASVTVALCGHWEHEGPCRWPNNSDYGREGGRTIFVAPPGEAPQVAALIERALREGAGWTVQEIVERDVLPEEHGLAQRLLRPPRSET
jgi:hypothetical protein